MSAILKLPEMPDECIDCPLRETLSLDSGKCVPLVAKTGRMQFTAKRGRRADCPLIEDKEE
jgi:hypothetical protein